VDNKYSISETKYGIEITIADYETADAFDDFLVDNNTHVNIKFLDVGMTFFFGQAITYEDVKKLIESFFRSDLSHQNLE
jgi:hypothetical protein